MEHRSRATTTATARASRAGSTCAIPTRPVPVAQMDLDWSAHRAQRSPVETLLALVESLRSMEVDTLVAAKEEIRPAIDEMLTLGKEYRAMLDALEGPGPQKRKRA